MVGLLLLSQGALGQNNSLNFDGIDDSVEVGSDAVHELRGDLTLEAWIKIESYPDADPFPFAYIISRSGIGEDEDTNALYTLAITDEGRLDAFHESGAGQNHSVFSNAIIPLNVWVHVAEVRDATAQTYQLFLNGVGEPPVTYDSNPTGGENSTVLIGNRPYTE